MPRPDTERMSNVASRPPRAIRPGLAFWSLDRVLDLRSGEADLLCRRGAHVSGHPHFCRFGCLLEPDPSGTVRAVLPYKKHSRLWDNDRPVVVESGWLLDGHHRVAYAVTRQLDGVWVQTVRGRLDEYRQRYRHIRAQAAD